MKRIDLFKRDLAEKTAVKVIAGIDNFDVENVRKVISAAEKAQASAVDISADAEIIKMAKEMTTIPVFVSSIVPEELQRALELGADAIEIGNFDTLYRNGVRITAAEVLEITRKTMSLIEEDVFVCVTIPGHIGISEQVELAAQLEKMHIDLVQVEGSAVIEAKSAGARGLLEASQVSLANTIEIARNTDIPVMSASGITPTTASLFFASGASAIGVGSCINRLSTEIEMLAVIKSLMESAKTARKESVNA